MNKPLEIVSTEDGSITCFDEAAGELYHNRAGAYTEAFKNYVEPCGLSQKTISQSNIRLLDVCFGLGYNSFVFLDQLIDILDNSPEQPPNLKIQILGIDRDVKILEVVPTVLAHAKFNRLLDRIAQNSREDIAWVSESLSSFGSHELFISKNISLEFEIRLADIRQALPALALLYPGEFDFIFHDGFSPRKMPELWTIDLFKHYANLLKTNGRIMTYSAATAVRASLMACGLEVKKTSPVGGKSGGTLAAFPGQVLTDKNIQELCETEKARLVSGVPYRDLTFADSREEILSRRHKEIAAKL